MNLTNAIYASSTVSITELRRNPGAIIEEAGQSPVAILNHNRATAYLVPAEAFEAMVEKLEDLELAEIVRQRRGGKTVKVSLDDLWAWIQWARLEEWKKLDHAIQAQFKKLLERRLLDPHVPSARLRGAGMQHTYKIKLRASGYRLVYEVHDNIVTVILLSVGKRDKNQVYKIAGRRK